MLCEIIITVVNVMMKVQTVFDYHTIKKPGFYQQLILKCSLIVFFLSVMFISGVGDYGCQNNIVVCSRSIVLFPHNVDKLLILQ